MRFFVKLDEYLMSLVFWMLFVIVALQFFTRYVLNDSLGWTEEIARMTLIVVTYLGSVVCARMETHIRVDFIADMLKGKLQEYYRLFIDILSSVLFFFLAVTAVRFAAKSRLEMSTIEVPKSVIFYICAACLFFMGVHYLIHFVKRLKKLYSNRHVTLLSVKG